jgi:hypothetical protein
VLWWLDQVLHMKLLLVGSLFLVLVPLAKLQDWTQKRIQEFYFVDYAHQAAAEGLAAPEMQQVSQCSHKAL